MINFFTYGIAHYLTIWEREDATVAEKIKWFLLVLNLAVLFWFMFWLLNLFLLALTGV